MLNYNYNNWGEYANNLAQFPGHGKDNPFKTPDKDPGKETRQTVNYFARAASIAHGMNPTYVTPQFEQKMKALNADAQNAQFDAAKKTQDAQFAQRGIYGQGAHQAAANDLAARRASSIAKADTTLQNQMDATKFQNWNDWSRQRFSWLNMLDQLAIQKQQLDLQRAQIASQNKSIDAQKAAANNPLGMISGLAQAGMGLGAAMLA